MRKEVTVASWSDQIEMLVSRVRRERVGFLPR